MNEEKMYIPSGLKTRDGKDIMCYTGEFYLKNKEKIDKLVCLSIYFYILLLKSI